MLLALSGTFLFSLKPIVIKYAYAEGLSSAQVICLRMLFSLPFYAGVLIYYYFKKPERRKVVVKHIIPVAVLGILGYFVASYLDLLGLNYISAQLERVVLFCFPTIVVLMSAIFFNTKLPKNIWLVLAMSYCGILLIFAHDITTLGSEVALGTGLVFLSAIAFSVYVLWSKPLMLKMGSQVFTSIAMIAASVVIFTFFTVSESLSSLAVSKEALLICAALAFFCTVIPSLLVAEAIQRIGPERTSIAGTSGPVITSILAVVFLEEAFTMYHLTGLVLIIIAIGLASKQK
uniref:DMT family transporter n=1 Tax=Ningiella ruwaisensis TaxID=2364274 RepID=UPI00109F80FE|nr:DMT family transporter [Ningiella ruwaisensis]